MICWLLLAITCLFFIMACWLCIRPEPIPLLSINFQMEGHHLAAHHVDIALESLKRSLSHKLWEEMWKNRERSWMQRMPAWWTWYLHFIIPQSSNGITSPEGRTWRHWRIWMQLLLCFRFYANSMKMCACPDVVHPLVSSHMIFFQLIIVYECTRFWASYWCQCFQSRFGEGILVTGVLFTVLISTVVIVDSHIWRVIRKPLAPFFLTRPFCMSAVISSGLGCFFVPLLDWVKAHQVFRTEGPKDHFTKAGTATMGGLFFIPVGIGVARFATGNSVELWGVCATTLAFATIGLLDDGLTIRRKHNYGMPGWFKFLLQVCHLWI